MARPSSKSDAQDALTSELLDLGEDIDAPLDRAGDFIVDLTSAEGVRALSAYLQNVHLGRHGGDLEETAASDAFDWPENVLRISRAETDPIDSVEAQPDSASVTSDPGNTLAEPVDLLASGFATVFEAPPASHPGAFFADVPVLGALVETGAELVAEQTIMAPALGEDGEEAAETATEAPGPLGLILSADDAAGDAQGDANAPPADSPAPDATDDEETAPGATPPPEDPSSDETGAGPETEPETETETETTPEGATPPDLEPAPGPDLDPGPPPTPPNTAPIVLSNMGDQAVLEDGAFLYDAAAHFSDADAGDSLSYSLGSNAPDWLSIDSATGALSGTPDNNDVGGASVTVIAVDSAGETAEMNFTLTVSNVNDAPESLALEEAFVNEGADGATISEIFVTDVDNVAGDFSFTVSDARFEVVEGQGGTPFLKLVDGVDLDHETEPTVSFDLTVTDTDGAAFTQTVSIEIEDNPEAPSAVVLSATAFDEGFYDRVDVVVADLSAVDEDSGDAFTYAIVSDPSGLFFLEDGQLMLADGDYDHETIDSYDITLRATDRSGLSVDTDFTIAVNDINEAPTSIWLEDTSMRENNAGADEILIAAIDPDDGDWRATWSVSDSRFEVFDDDGEYVLKLKDGTALDYEVEQDVTFTLTATDTDGASYDQIVTLTVQDVAEHIDVSDYGGAFTDDGVQELSITGSARADTITGSAQDDVIDGGLGADVLAGGDGADTLIMGDGDRAAGGAGDDLFEISSADGSFQIDGGAGWEDVISLSATGGGSTSGTGITWTIELDDGSTYDVVSGSSASELDFGEEVSGVISNSEGIDIDFTNIERIEWT